MINNNKNKFSKSKFSLRAIRMFQIFESSESHVNLTLPEISIIVCYFYQHLIINQYHIVFSLMIIRYYNAIKSITKFKVFICLTLIYKPWSMTAKIKISIQLKNLFLLKNFMIYLKNWKTKKNLTPTWFEHATFRSGVERATVAPRSPYWVSMYKMTLS